MMANAATGLVLSHCKTKKMNRMIYQPEKGSEYLSVGAKVRGGNS